MRSRVRRAGLVAVCSLALLAPSRAIAQPPAAPAAPVAKRAAVLLFSGCGVEGAPPRAVSEVLALELDAANVRLKAEDEGFGAGDLLLVVRGGCEASEPLTLRASLDGAQRERSLLLDDVPDSARARTLALSLAELGELVVSGAPAEGTTPAPEQPTSSDEAAKPESGTESTKKEPEPEKPKPSPPAATEPTTLPTLPEEDRRELFAQPAPAETRNSISASLSNRWFQLEQLTWGGRMRVDISSVFFGGEALYGRSMSNIGSVEGLVIDAILGVRLLSYEKNRLFRFAAGPRVGAGAVNVSGTPTEGVFASNMLEMYLDAALVTDLRLEIADAVKASLSVELGAARGVTALADGQRVSEFGGFFMGLTLGIVFGL